MHSHNRYLFSLANKPSTSSTLVALFIDPRIFLHSNERGHSFSYFYYNIMTHHIYIMTHHEVVVHVASFFS